MGQLSAPGGNGSTFVFLHISMGDRIVVVGTITCVIGPPLAPDLLLRMKRVLLAAGDNVPSLGFDENVSDNTDDDASFYCICSRVHVVVDDLKAFLLC